MKIIKLDKTRVDLAKTFKGIGTEIGVERGVFSKIICEQGKIDKFFAIDCWQTFKGYREHVNQEKLDSFYEITKEKLKTFNTKLIRKFSLDAAKDFVDGSLDFVYIDANHKYEEVLKDLEVWSKKVKKGGIIAGHDYIERKDRKNHSVFLAVNDFAESEGVEKLVIYAKDSSPSWCFIKSK